MMLRLLKDVYLAEFEAKEKDGAYYGTVTIADDHGKGKPVQWHAIECEGEWLVERNCRRAFSFTKELNKKIVDFITNQLKEQFAAVKAA